MIRGQQRPVAHARSTEYVCTCLSIGRSNVNILYSSLSLGAHLKGLSKMMCIMVLPSSDKEDPSMPAVSHHAKELLLYAVRDRRKTAKPN